MSRELIDSFATDTIEVCRHNQGEWVRGRYVNGPQTTLTMNASVQPIDGNQMLMLPEARRTRENLQCCTADRLLTTDEKALCKADIVTWRGNRYEIHRTEDWTNTDLPHYNSLMTKVVDEGRSE